MTRPKTVFIGEPKRTIIERSKMKIIHGKAVQDKIGPTIPLNLAENIALTIIYAIRNADRNVRVSIAGSIRRKVENIHDIDILVSPSSNYVRDCIGTLGKVLWSGPEKVSIVLNIQPGEFLAKDAFSVQVDIRSIPVESWGPGLQYFTGSREHNISLRSIAKAKGLLLNEHGLWDSNGNRIDNNKEGSIYTALGLRWLPPKYRNRYIGATSRSMTKNNIENHAETRKGPSNEPGHEDVSQSVQSKNVDSGKNTLSIVIGEKRWQEMPPNPHE